MSACVGSTNPGYLHFLACFIVSIFFSPLCEKKIPGLCKVKVAAVIKQADACKNK